MSAARCSNIDDEWQKFISYRANDHDDNNYIDDDDSSSSGDLDKMDTNELSCENNTNKRRRICSSGVIALPVSNKDIANSNDSSSSHENNLVAPQPTDIYISTKSKIAYLTHPVELKIFWEIPVIPYATPCDGIVKKQIKFNSATAEELAEIQEKLKSELYCDEQIITSINNPAGRVKFKDIRKITVGISKKDIMSYRSKKKQAFYNCFVMILRIRIENVFKEFHVKVFNTGKLEIPGVQSDTEFEAVLRRIIYTLQPFISEPISYNKKSDTVLINSNFNCGFYINREVLYDILKYKYKIQCIYDPCSYPGIQCKFFHNPEMEGISNGVQIAQADREKFKNIVEVSFMIFRTGSILIVGMCEEDVLFKIYEFLKGMLRTEFTHICQEVIAGQNAAEINNQKKRKVRRRTIEMLCDSK